MPRDSGLSRNSAASPTSSMSDGLPERRALGVVLDQARRCRERRDDASVLIGPAEIAFTRMPCGPEVVGEVAHGRLERGLRHAHHVVALHDPLAAEVGQRDDAGLPPLHERQRGACDPHQGIGADVEGDLEVLARCVGKHPIERLARRERQRVDEEIEVADRLAESSHSASIWSSFATSHWSEEGSRSRAPAPARFHRAARSGR